MKTNHQLAYHLIMQDLLYHRMIYGVQKHDVHIEFYPDLATVVLQLLGLDDGSDGELTDLYTGLMAKVEALGKEDELENLATSCLNALLKVV